MRPAKSALLVVVAACVAWALWPAGDSRFEIRFDPEAERASRAFLDRPDAPGPDGAARDRPPNVVLVVADDLGKHDVSVYEPAAVKTPNLERLAQAGVVFTQGYVTSPVCSPSRAALLTGRYPQRFGFELLTHDRYPRNRLEWWVARLFFSAHGWNALDELRVPLRGDIERQGLPPGELTLAELLRRRGYATALFGKWHLGWSESMQPQSRGFEHQYGFYDAFSLYADRDDPQMIGVRGDYFADRYQWWRGRSGGSAIRRDGAVIEEHGYLTDRIAEEAGAWILAQRERPFFAYVPFNAPHAPLQAPRAYVDRFAGEPSLDRRVYLAMIAALDDAVGRLLGALDRAGVADDTIVIFLSDNGAATYTGVASNAPLKAGKLTNFEGGVNVPFLMRWPARLAGAARYGEPVSSLDAFMTVVRAAGAELPGDRPYDGVDLLPHLRGEATGAPHETLYWRAAGHRAVRSGRYKLISDAATGTRVLYDLERDPSERSDLSDQQASLADELERRLREWEAALMPPRWPNVMEYRFREDGRDFAFPL
jgi:arylsulfatase A-like enzyme